MLFISTGNLKNNDRKSHIKSNEIITGRFNTSLTEDISLVLISSTLTDFFIDFCIKISKISKKIKIKKVR